MGRAVVFNVVWPLCDPRDRVSVDGARWAGSGRVAEARHPHLGARPRTAAHGTLGALRLDTPEKCKKT